jgi:hypothetical protein
MYQHIFIRLTRLTPTCVHRKKKSKDITHKASGFYPREKKKHHHVLDMERETAISFPVRIL